MDQEGGLGERRLPLAGGSGLVQPVQVIHCSRPPKDGSSRPVVRLRPSASMTSSRQRSRSVPTRSSVSLRTTISTAKRIS
jgi:hypothetical protein